MTSTMRFDKWENSLGTSYNLPVQVVSKTYGEATSTTLNRTYVLVNNGSLSITPRLNNSSFLVTISMAGYVNVGTGVNIGLSRTISGNTVRLLGVDGGNGDTWMGANHTSGHASSWNLTKQLLDSPNVVAGTTVTYNSLLGQWDGASTAGVNWDGSLYGGKSTITIMEIAQ